MTFAMPSSKRATSDLGKVHVPIVRRNSQTSVLSASEFGIENHGVLTFSLLESYYYESEDEMFPSDSSHPSSTIEDYPDTSQLFLQLCDPKQIFF